MVYQPLQADPRSTAQVLRAMHSIELVLALISVDSRCPLMLAGIVFDYGNNSYEAYEISGQELALQVIVASIVGPVASVAPLSGWEVVKQEVEDQA